MKIFILVVSLSVNKIMTNHRRSRSLVLVNTGISKAMEGYQGEQFNLPGRTGLVFAKSTSVGLQHFLVESVKCLPYSHENLGLDPLYHVKRQA